MKYCRSTCARATLYINIYLHREYHKASFTCCLIGIPKIYFDQCFFYFSVHGDQQSNIYSQCCLPSGSDMPSSPKSSKCFSGDALKAPDLDPILLVTLHPVKICALSSAHDFSVPKISANW